MNVPFLALLLSTLCAPALAQTVGGEMETKFQFDGAAANDKLGWSVSSAGDVNGDGFPDLIVGAPYAEPGGITSAGSAFVYSGADGSALWQFHGVSTYGNLGDSVSGAGDVNGDGLDDIIVGAWQADAGGFTAAGSAFVFSGADGSPLWQFDGAVEFDYHGQSVSGAGDVNGDGFDDLIVGASGADPGGLSVAGSAFVYSGADGSTLWQFDGAAAYATLGASVSGAGDVNGDGFPDLIVGAPGTDPGGLLDAGSAFVYSGANGFTLWLFDGAAAYERLGTSVSGAGDVNGDGFHDIIVGAPGASPGGLTEAGSTFVYSGADESTLWRFDGAAASDYLGWSVSGAGDVNGDGFHDIIVSAWHADPGGLTSAGSVFVYGMNPFLTSTTSTVSASSASNVSLQLDFPDTAASWEYRVLLSAAGTGPFTYGVDIPLTLDSFARNSYLGNYPFPSSSGLQGTLDPNGDAGATFGFPANYLSSVVGTTVYFAAAANPVGQLPALSSVAVPMTVVL